MRRTRILGLVVTIVALSIVGTAALAAATRALPMAGPAGGADGAVLAVLLPAAILLVASVAEVLWAVGERPGWHRAARLAGGIGVGFLVLVAAVEWGGIAGTSGTSPLAAVHRGLLTAAMVVGLAAIGAGAWSERRPGPRSEWSWWGGLLAATFVSGAAGLSAASLVVGWPVQAGASAGDSRGEVGDGAGGGAGGGEDGGVGREVEPAAVVRMNDELRFEPERLTIEAGETVLWEGVGTAVHTVTADPDLVADPDHVALPEDAEAFHSGYVGPGETWRRTFTVPGTYRYVCLPHEADGMLGELRVRAATDGD